MRIFDPEVGERDPIVDESEETPVPVFPKPAPAFPRPQPAPPIILPIASKESGLAPFETLFHDFQLAANSKYNYWIPDETENDLEEVGERTLDELPRYVRLSWKIAPDIKDPNAFGKEQLQGSSRDVAGSAELGVTLNGINFSPTNLSDFNIAAQTTANGYLAAGIVETVVEVPENITRDSKIQSNLVDEDAYLAKPGLWGIPFSEFNNVLWNMKSSVYGVQRTLYSQRLSEATEALRRYFVDGQFGVVSPSVMGEPMEIRSSLMEFSAQTADSGRVSPVSRISEILESLTAANEEKAGSQYVRSKFIDTNLVGLVNENRVASVNAPEQAEAIAAIAPYLGNLIVYAEVGVQDKNRQVSIPSFPAPSDLPPLEYVGYVIEKYTFDGGTFSLRDRLYISGRETNEYIDTKVKYGTTYRYRIRAILRWSRPRGTGVYGVDSTVITSDTSTSLTPNEASFFASEWSSKWAKVQVIDLDAPNPPDELRVVPVSGGENGPEVWISMKVPYNPQRDITKLALFRRIEGEHATNWELVGEFPVENVRHVDRDVSFFQKNKHRYVYAAACYTVHGEISVLSEQLAVRLNENWRKMGEFPVEFISCAGVEKDIGVGLFATYPERRIRSELIVGTQNTVSVTSQVRLGRGVMAGNHYVFRVESLDNGQSVDIPVDISYTNQPPDIIIRNAGVMIPNGNR